MIKVFILTFEALCVLSLVCVVTLTPRSLGARACPALPSDTHTRSQGRGPASSPAARTPLMVTWQVKTCCPLGLGWPARCAGAGLNRAGESVLHGVCAESIGGEETACWELVPGAPGRAGHGHTSRPSWCQRGTGYQDWCLSLRAKALRMRGHGGSAWLSLGFRDAPALLICTCCGLDLPPHREFSLTPRGWNSSDLSRCSLWPHFSGAGRGWFGLEG